MISIVIPLYNKEQYIGACLNSVLSQTYKDFELIVVNDGSSDNSVDIVNMIRDERVQLLSKNNGGPASARNLGVKEAKGEWVVFLDADDIFLPFALEYFIELISKHPGYSYYCCNYMLKTNNETTLFSKGRFEGEVPNNFYFEFTERLTDRPGSAIYKRDILLNNPFNDRIRRYEDSEVQYRLLNNYRVYQSWIPVMITNRDASCAAGYRKDIEEDFIGHLDFKNKTFWEKMQLYKLAREIYYGYPRELNRYKELHRVSFYFIYISFRMINKIRGLFSSSRSIPNYTIDYLLKVTDYRCLLK